MPTARKGLRIRDNSLDRSLIFQSFGLARRVLCFLSCRQDVFFVFSCSPASKSSSCLMIESESQVDISPSKHEASRLPFFFLSFVVESSTSLQRPVDAFSKSLRRLHSWLEKISILFRVVRSNLLSRIGELTHGLVIFSTQIFTADLGTWDNGMLCSFVTTDMFKVRLK